MPVKSYRDLKVWQASMILVEQVYHLTQNFPAEEKFGLTSQMRRVAVSVPSNIAEGHAKASTREFLRHLSIALGSLAELETQLFLAERLRYIHQTHLDPILAQADEVGKMLRGLQKALEKRV